MASADVSGPAASAWGFDRPLVVTAPQDRIGRWLRGAGRLLLLTLTGTSVVAVLLIFFFVVREAWPFFAKHGVTELLGSLRWYPEAEHAEFGALGILYGSALVTAGAMAVAVPVGLLVAVVLSDIVPFGVRQVVKPIVELLAAIPSVAYGFFAVLVLAPFLQAALGLATGTNALNASLLLAIMAIPTIVSMSEDCLTAVGPGLREASYALGATRTETVVRVVMPAAGRGLLAAVLLGMMRAVGETMVVWMASGNAAQIPTPWYDLTQSVRTITATIAGDMGETVKGSDHYRALFALGFLLLGFTLGLNLLTEHLLRRARRES